VTGETRRPPRKVACPCCGAPAEFSPANPWRPFCSERCRQVDLGAWASEAYRIPQREAGPEPGPDEAEGGGRGSNTPGQ
jgi:hypothetical protein